MLSNEPYFESLRDLLTHLERIGRLQRISKTVDKDWEIACITRQVMYQPPDRRYAILFESVAGFDATPAGRTAPRPSKPNHSLSCAWVECGACGLGKTRPRGDLGSARPWTGRPGTTAGPTAALPSRSAPRL